MTLKTRLALAGAFFKSLFAKNWKVMLALAAIVALIFAAHKYHQQYGEAQFKRGVAATLAQVKTEVAKRNTVNRAIETRADEGLKDFAATKAEEAVERKAAEQKVADKIATTVESVPMWKSQECAVTPQVLADRNAIRALGPDAEGETK